MSSLVAAAPVVSSENPWLYHKRWDLTFIIGSAALGAIPLILLYGFNVSTTAINLLVAGLVGGPHLYSTFGYTLVEGAYRKKQGWLLLPCAIIPVVVTMLAHFNLILVGLDLWNEINSKRASWIKDCPSILVIKHHHDLPRDVEQRVVREAEK